MNLIKIPYTDLQEGQHFKFTERQRKFRVFEKTISLRDVAYARKAGDESLVIYDNCSQQPMKAGQEVFISQSATETVA
jgi:hypothetical protein